jgi:ABC-type glycerol-3-phosphate transport system permease component
LTGRAINSTNAMALPLCLATFQGAHATDWTPLMGRNMRSLIPMLLVFLLVSAISSGWFAATGLAGA